MMGAAMNVYYRDVASAMPVALSLLMYASPVIYQLTLVQQKLLVNQAAGERSNFFYFLYTLSPGAGGGGGGRGGGGRGRPPGGAARGPGGRRAGGGRPRGD